MALRSKEGRRERLMLDTVIGSQPELGPAPPDGGYGWVILFGVLMIQFGFRKGRTTVDAILSLLESAYNGFEDKMYSEITLCDLTKAFDCVSNDILRLKLQYYGINGRELDLL
ncbi:hypothetical protein ANN_17671 [Periplaneta americana]|uniref:Uncharacterized protein n=1 Tax=Periplaneta americana TaxID=6978 RepID=A0ABQ8SUT8_PERAM|nr:hypothetical protein ANN_17671 [Periplaneta americana]